MDLRPYLNFLADHPFSVVFWSSFIEAAGVPFPSRVILVLTPAFLATEIDLVRLVIVGTAGAVLGGGLARPPCSSVASRRACDCSPRRARGVRT